METSVAQKRNKKLGSASSIPKSRSPNYPSLSLPEALKKVELLHKAAYSATLDSDTVAKAMGFSSGKNGSALKTISAAKKYSLIEEAPRGLKVSDLAVDILLETKGSPKRAEALRRAAYAPPLFLELQDQYGDLLPIDDVMKANLVKNGFTRDAAGIAIKKYRETIEFISIEAPEKSIEYPDTHLNFAPNNDISKPYPDAYKAEGTALMPSASSTNETLLFRLSKECSVKLVFEGSLTVRGIEKLIALLELNKDAYPES